MTDILHPHGYGVEMLDTQGKLTEMAGTTPRGPRVAAPPSYPAPIRGDGKPLHPVGSIHRDIETHQRMTQEPECIEDKIRDTYRRFSNFRATARHCGVTEHEVRQLFSTGTRIKKAGEP